jgi:DNA-binding transcriptional LysR family regulator
MLSRAVVVTTIGRFRALAAFGTLRRVLPDWIAGDSTLTALIPYRQGLLPSVRAFLDHLAAEFPKAVLI